MAGKEAAKQTVSAKSAKTFSSSEINSMISKKAFELFKKRGLKHGNDRGDWFEAEKQVKRELGLR